jgi:hypothetical protein
MKTNFKFLSSGLLALCILVSSCSKELTDANINPNGVSPETGNPNLTLPTVMVGAAQGYTSLGFGKISGVMQHTQEDGWYSGFNFYDWSPDDWSGWYGLLRNNQFIYDRAVELDYPFHQGVALTMKSFMFGVVTDLWGDAPYTNALKAGTEEAILFPEYDNQETIYKGIIEDLKAAASLFAGAGDISNSYAEGYDVYYNGDVEKWQKFTNSLLLRYYMRVSDKLPEIAKTGIEGIYASGIYMKETDDDATMDYIGTTADNSWPQTPIAFDASQSNWRRRKAAAALMDKLNEYNDPRRNLWFQPVHVQWVADPTLATPKDQFIRKNGVIIPNVESYDDQEFQDLIVPGVKFTRRYNPNTYTPNPPYTFGTIDDGEYVGIKAGYNYPDFYNENPTPGQNVQNQHVSQLSNLFKESSGDLLKAKLMTSAETSFILAEAAQKGWAAGSAEDHYQKGIENSLAAWGLEDDYDDYIAEDGVAFDGTQAQIIEQKWIASFTSTLEAWFDFRRTGLPALVPGTASPAPVLPVRLIYGDNELNYNTANANSGIERNETNANVGPRGKNSQWAKPWIIQGTGKPW